MDLRLAPFRFDVTPPIGHSLCGGWIKPAVAVDDPLEAIGFVLIGMDAPIVVASFDWCGILNSAHVELRSALAKAAGTTPDRVTVHTVHQHNAPFVCLDAHATISRYSDIPPIVDLTFWKDCLERGAATVQRAMQTSESLTHISTGQAVVERIASNRRFLNPEGKVFRWRGSSTRDASLQALPEGLIDPLLRTVVFLNGDRPLVSIHHYATHPMSYYGDGRVTADFVGLARRRREKDDPSITHLYLTGCAGNIAPGKYNEGTPQSRLDLADRLYAAIIKSEENLSPEPIKSISWKAAEFLAPPGAGVDADKLLQQIGDAHQSLPFRTRPAMQLAWLKRWEKGTPPVTVSSLSINQMRSVHLPGECFVEYQLRLAERLPKEFVLGCAYGDGGPWYIPIADCYPQGGYEVEQAFCEKIIDAKMSQAIEQVISS
ncbi:hypothetical protein K2X85_09585 [bacterium]|nr:hypothetical protein [bacterium]